MARVGIERAQGLCPVKYHLPLMCLDLKYTTTCVCVCVCVCLPPKRDLVLELMNIVLRVMVDEGLFAPADLIK